MELKGKYCYKVLNFGKTTNDYIMFGMDIDMSPFTNLKIYTRTKDNTYSE